MLSLNYEFEWNEVSGVDMDRTRPEMIKGNENKMNGTESTEVDLYLLSEVFEVLLSKITIQKKKQGVSSEHERWVFGKVLSSESVFYRIGPRVFYRENK